MAHKALANALKIRNLAIEQQVNALLGPLNEKKNAISLSSNALSVLSRNIEQNTVKYQKDIESYFENITEQIQLQKQYLFNKISLIEQKKMSEIEKQRQTLTNMQKITFNALQSCNTIINNKTDNLKVTEKRQKVCEITNKALDKTVLPTKISAKPKIKCIFNDNTSSFIRSLCTIADNTLKPLPLITDMKCDSITNQSVIVRWNAKLSLNNSDHKSSDLYMKVCIACDGSDEKETDCVNISGGELLFENNKNEYLYKFADLSPNEKYKVCIKCIEMDQTRNNKLERTDFETVSVTLKTKKQPRNAKLFTFQSGNETMKVSNDGLSVSGYGQLRFGEYLKAENKQIYTVTLSMDNIDINDCGIGFATTGFINTHNNHRMVVYGNGKMLMANEFKNGKKLSQTFWKEGDTIVIEIDMKKRRGIMYRKYKNDIGIDNLDEFYRVDVPEVVAVCVRFGTNTTQTVSVVQQRIHC